MGTRYESLPYEYVTINERKGYPPPQPVSELEKMLGLRKGDVMYEAFENSIHTFPKNVVGSVWSQNVPQTTLPKATVIFNHINNLTKTPYYLKSGTIVNPQNEQVTYNFVVDGGKTWMWASNTLDPNDKEDKLFKMEKGVVSIANPEIVSFNQKFLIVPKMKK